MRRKRAQRSLFLSFVPVVWSLYRQFVQAQVTIKSRHHQLRVCSLRGLVLFALLIQKERKRNSNSWRFRYWAKQVRRSQVSLVDVSTLTANS